MISSHLFLIFSILLPFNPYSIFSMDVPISQLTNFHSLDSTPLDHRPPDRLPPSFLFQDVQMHAPSTAVPAAAGSLVVGAPRPPPWTPLLTLAHRLSSPRGRRRYRAASPPRPNPPPVRRPPRPSLYVRGPLRRRHAPPRTPTPPVKSIPRLCRHRRSRVELRLRRGPVSPSPLRRGQPRRLRLPARRAAEQARPHQAVLLAASLFSVSQLCLSLSANRLETHKKTGNWNIANLIQYYGVIFCIN